MLKQVINSLLASWVPLYVWPEYASLVIQTPLTPLLAVCDASLQTVRDEYVCSRARGIQHSYRFIDNESRHIDIDVMPDMCGSVHSAPSHGPASWTDRIRQKLGDITGWNMSEPIYRAVFREGEAWRELTVEGDWTQVRKTLECLSGIPTVNITTNKLSVDIRQPPSRNPFDYTEANRPTKLKVFRTTTQLLSTIRTLSKLHTFRIHIPLEETTWFSEALSLQYMVKVVPVAQRNNGTDEKDSPVSTSVKSLVLSPFTHLLLAHMPHVKNISLNSWSMYGGTLTAQDELVAAIKRFATPVEHLQLWEPMKGKLQDIARDINGLRSLDLGHGSLNQWMFGGPFDFKTLLPDLALLTNLTTLMLPPVQVLDPEFNPPWCGNAYMDDPTLSDRVAAEGREAEGRVIEYDQEAPTRRRTSTI